MQNHTNRFEPKVPQCRVKYVDLSQKYHSTESNIASPWHLDADTLDSGYDRPGVDARPQLEPLIRPVRDNKLVNVGLDIGH